MGEGRAASGAALDGADKIAPGFKSGRPIMHPAWRELLELFLIAVPAFLLVDLAWFPLCSWLDRRVSKHRNPDGR